MIDKTQGEHNESGLPPPESRHPSGHGFAPLRANSGLVMSADCLGL